MSLSVTDLERYIYKFFEALSLHMELAPQTWGAFSPQYQCTKFSFNTGIERITVYAENGDFYWGICRS